MPYAIQYQWLAMRLVLPVYKLGIYLSLHGLHFSTHADSEYLHFSTRNGIAKLHFSTHTAKQTWRNKAATKPIKTVFLWSAMPLPFKKNSTKTENGLSWWRILYV